MLLGMGTLPCGSGKPTLLVALVHLLTGLEPGLRAWDPPSL